MRTSDFKVSAILKAVLVASILLLSAGASFAQQQVNLTAQPSTAILPDGTSVPMWGYNCGTLVSGSTATCATLNPAATLSGGAATTTAAAVQTVWSPIIITVPAGATGGLQINLTNALSFTPATGSATPNTIPTSIVIMGQVGGGLGGVPTTTPSPNHSLVQGCPTWFIANPGIPGQPCTAPVANSSGTPPAQGPRIQSMGSEVAAGATTSLSWTYLKPGTYLLESGTHPSIQVPMGLIGVLVVTGAPGSTAATALGAATGSGCAYGTAAVAATTTAAAIPASCQVPYGAEVPAEFSEIDPVQNKEVDLAVRTAGFSETAVWTRMNAFGPVTALTVGTAGSGYTSAPAVTISGGAGAGASGTAIVGALVSTIAVTNGGTGYTAPTVTITDTTGTGATATATVVGGVITAITVTNPGSLYTAPIVIFTDATGTGAAATASIIGTSGAIYALNLTNGGEGFSSAPLVSITAPTGAGGAQATASASITLGGCGSAVAHTCYPPAVNYTPFYYLINGVAFNKTNAAGSVFAATAGTSTNATTGVTSPVTTGITCTVVAPATTCTPTLLVRLVNAGLRMHVPSIVNSLTQGFNGAGVASTVGGFTLIAEDGNPLPNLAAPRVQTDVFMAAGKVFDVMVNVPAAGATSTPALPIYDRELSLSANSSVRDAGMLAYLSVNNATPSSSLPVAAGTGVFAAATANPDIYSSVVTVAGVVQPLTVSDPSKGVIANDINVYGVTLLTAPLNGTLTCPAAVTGTSNAGICANGTFTWTPTGATASDTFQYCANGTVTAATTTTAAACSSGVTATVTLNASGLTGNPTAIAQTYTSPSTTYLKISSPGLLLGNSDPSHLGLSVVVPTTAPAINLVGASSTGTATVVMDAGGGFVLSVPGNKAAGTASFPYTVQDSQGRTASGTVTVTFQTPSNLQVNVLDAQSYNSCHGDSGCIAGLISNKITDYRWIIEEDQTFWIDPNCTTNASATTAGCPSIVGASGQSTIPSFGVNFHTSAMPYIAQGCTGPLSCESGQTVLDTRPACTTAGVPAGCSATAGQHVPAVCDVGNGACRPDPNCTTLPCLTSGGTTPSLPSSVHLDPSKRYYISVLPGDAANPFPTNLAAPDCSQGAIVNNALNTACGHTMSGAPVPPACNILGGLNACPTTAGAAPPPFAAVNVLVLPTPLPTGKLSIIVFEDDFPLNGEQDGGGGNGTVAPIEPGLGGFNIVLWDTYGGLGDVTGQNTYDEFNQPLANALAGTGDPVTGLDACPVSKNPLTVTTGTGAGQTTSTGTNGITGMIVTCPKYESDGTTLSPLAGQAVIANLMPEKFSVQAYPGADRIARGEQWIQTNTLDGQHPHDSFIRIGEPSYFQEYGPAGYHVAIGFANPAIINARLKDVCAGAGSPGAVGPCSNTIYGQVDVERLSRTPDQRLYPSGSRAGFAWTQCWVSLGDPDGEDFMFTFCDANGNFKFTGVPGGNWRVTLGDQWNDQIIDGLSVPANVGCVPASGQTTCTGGTTSLNLQNLGAQQWQANLYTRTYVDDNKNGVWDSSEIGIPFIYTMIHYRDGHNSNALTTDFNGIANFNETFPLFNWYVVEADSGRYKTTGIHTVYDAGGPADGSPSCASTARPCGSSPAYQFLSNTYESVPLPTDLSVPGAVYCKLADCASESASFALGTAVASSPTAGLSTGRIDPPWVGSEGWSGLTSMSNWIDFGKAPYAACNPAAAVSSTNFCVSVPSTTVNPTTGGTTATTTKVGENGGIIGDVIYASTRPFDDASQMITQPWEPHIPHVTMNLYQEGFAADGVTPTLTMVDTTTTSSWDDWAQGFYPGSTASGGQKPYMSCPGQGTAVSGTANQDLFFFTLFDQPNYLDLYNSQHNGGTLHTLPYNSQYKCYDAMHVGNQLQPAPYDGKYSFPSSLGVNPTTGKLVSTVGSTNGVTATMNGTNCTICVQNPDSTDHFRYQTPMLPPGKYVVEVIMPPGYEVYKEEDKNLLIGDNFIAPVTQEFSGLGAYIFILPDQANVASMYDSNADGYNPNNFQNQTTSLALQAGTLSGVPGFPGFQDPLWPCVGEMRVVPDYLSIYPQNKEVAPFAGATRPLCDRKEVTLATQTSSNARFFIFTSTHIASKFAGVITDDFTSEFDPFAPQFGEKFGPPNMPISTKDYLGNELSRVYSDHWGAYDGLTFSSWEVNPPNITGYSPSMMTQCMNDPGPIMDNNPSSATYGHLITDPLFNPAYSNFCYEEPYMPGLTNYTDTPVVPTQAFVGAGYNNADCSYPDATPAIKEADGDGIGPWVGAEGNKLTITAMGSTQVINYAYSGPSASVAPFNMKTVTRTYGFGTRGTLSAVTIGGQKATIQTWSPTQIVVTVPSGVPLCAVQQQTQYGGSLAQCGQLVVTAANGKQSIDAVTVTIAGKQPVHVAASASIQTAIDTAQPGDLLMIDPTCLTIATTATPAATTACSASAVNATAPTQTASTASHQEMLIMWKPVRLQGVGAVSSVINANASPAGQLLDPWRRHINCFFGLTLQGVPSTGNVTVTGGNVVPGSGGATPYDPTGTYACPDTDNGGSTAWTDFTAQPNNPQIDRLPLEAVLGWDATQNGNLAEQLQEPSLMGAFEGAGITILAKGVEYHGSSPWSDGNEGGAFPTNTTLLMGVGPVPTALPTGDANSFCHTGTYDPTTGAFTVTSQSNPYPSNFMCNPSSIDGLTITNSSQGGGGIFAHGWAHYLQVANDRVYNNSGTLTGGINVGQGEFPTPYVMGSTTNAAPGSCSDGTGWINNQHLPYCLQIQVNVHNNFITNNSSLGDELFSGTLAGGGGVTFCTGNDYYEFQYNWVCGNLSSGEGGGVVHLGEIQNGDIEHNSIVFNQSQNPTIPTNGGGIQVMGTPDTDPVCGSQIDADCPPGLSDGIGHNLMINANLIQGNMAESGSGGGIRLQQVNGTEVSTFPGIYSVTAATAQPVVTITARGGSTLPAVGTTVTIAGVTPAGYNGTFTVTRAVGRTFQYVNTVAGLASPAVVTGATFTDGAGAVTTAQVITRATETGTGTVTVTSNLSPTVGDSVTITLMPAGFTGYNGTFTVTSIPAVGTFTYTTTRTGLNPFTATITATTSNAGSITDSNPDQATSSLWNGVIIQNNIIVNNVAGWDGAGISLQDALSVNVVNNTIADNDSLATSGVLTQSLGTPDASAPAGSCTNATGITSCPQSAGVTSTLNSSLLTTTFAGITVSCPPGNHDGGPAANGTCTHVSYPALYNNIIYQNRSFEVGVGTLGAGTQNQQNVVSLFNFGGTSGAPTQASTGSCSTTGVTYWDLGVRGDTGPGDHSSGYTLGPHDTVLTSTSGYGGGNTSNPPAFVSQYCNGSRVPPECSTADGCGGPSGYGVPPGIADATSPNPLFTLVASATVDEGNNWINVSWGPLTMTDPSILGPDGNYGGGLALGNYALSPSSADIDRFPTSETLPLGVNRPTLDFFGNPRPDSEVTFDAGAVESQNTAPVTVTASISPTSGNIGTSVPVTITGTGLTGTSAINVSGTGVTVTGIGVQSDTTVLATFVIAGTAPLGARNVTVVTPNGTVGAGTFTVTAPTPTLQNITPTQGLRGTAVPVTLNGTNLSGGTIHITGTGITISATTVNTTGTQMTATFTISPTAALTGRSVTVSVGAGANLVTSNAVTFTVVAPGATISPTSGVRGTTVAVTITGTNLGGATGVTMTGGGVSCVLNGTPSATTVLANCTITRGAGLTLRNVTVTDPTNGNVPVSNQFQITGATLTFSAPSPALTTTPANTTTKSGTITVTNTATGATGGPFTFTAAPTNTGTGFSITGGTCASGTVLSAGGTGNTCTIVVQYAPGTSTTTRTGHVTATGTGLATASQNSTPNFSGN